jgi:hypothetical protein
MDQHEGNFYRIMKMGARLARTCNGLEINGWNVLGPDLPVKQAYTRTHTREGIRVKAYV